MSNSDFGTTVPPLTEFIKNLLGKYTEGQILKEIVQNADDAGASTVRFVVDPQRYPFEGLVKDSLKPVQGPALLAWNNATFKEEDWSNIGKLYQSKKMEDKMKVGRFGIGFQSVHHITDLPVILSGEYMGILDPHTHFINERNDDGSQRTGLKHTLNHLRHRHYNHLKPFDGLFGFSHDMESYDGTLFRFPFRTKESFISEKKASVPQVLKELCSCLEREASRILLFLRHVTCIEIYSRSDSGQAKPMLELKGKVSLDHSCCNEVLKAQEEMEKASADDYGHSVSVIYPCTVLVEWPTSVTNKPQVYHWIICQTLGSENSQLKVLAKELRVSPWVGTAAYLPTSVSFKVRKLSAIQGRQIMQEAIDELQSHLSSATVHSLPSDQICRATDCVAFCFLPLPQATGLPVNIHGYFIPVDDRQRIKWPVGEMESDREAWWNLLLVQELLIPTYALAIVTHAMLFRFIASSTGSIECPGAYAMWPLLRELRNVHVWQFLLDADSSLLRMLIAADLPVFWSPVNGGTWVNSKKAVFALHKEMHPLASFLLDLGVAMVFLPQTIVESIHTDWLPRCLTPQIVHRVLVQCSSEAARRLKQKPKVLILLLNFLLPSLPPEALFGLPVIPLEDRQCAPAILTMNGKKEDQIYVIQDDLTASILCGLSNKILYRSLPDEISRLFQNLAECQQSQLRIPTKQQVCTSLLPQSLASWGAAKGVAKQWMPGVDGQPKRQCLVDIWQWLLQPDVDLNDVCGLPLVPELSLDREAFAEGNLLLPLVKDGSIMRVNWQDSVSEGLYRIAKKLGCCIIENYSHFHHYELARPSSLSCFLPLFTPVHLLTYLQRSSSVACSKLQSLQVEEKQELSVFLCGALTESPQLAFIAFLKSLPLFETAEPGVFVALDADTSDSLIFPQPNLNFPSHTHLSSVTLKTTSQNVKHLSVLMQRQPDTLVSIVSRHILPWVQQVSDIRHKNTMLVWLLSQCDEHDRELCTILSSTRFLLSNVVGDCNMYKPSELFGPSDVEVLKAFYTASEAVFPHSDFWDLAILAKLLLLGLQRWSDVTSNKERFSSFMVDRARSVAKLAEVDAKLARDRSVHLFSLVSNHTVSNHMKDALHRTKHIPYLFCDPPPSEYKLIDLHWKGKEFCRVPVCPKETCLPKGIYSSAIVGSVLPIVSKEYTELRADDPNVAASFKAIQPKDVLSHVANLVELQDRIQKCDTRKRIIWESMIQVYNYFHMLPQGCHLLHESKLPFIWNHNLGRFHRASEVAYEPIPGFPLQSSIMEMGLQSLGKEFWLRCGVRESSDVNDCFQALHAIKGDVEGKPELVQMHIYTIVRCLTEVARMLLNNSNRERLKGAILLPTKDGHFVSPQECVYDDRQWNEKGLSGYYGPLVHSEISPALATALGVSPLSSRIGRPQALKINFQQKGQHEPLTRRLRRIIEDYKDNIDVFKELIQNADDAGATQIKFLLDWRQHPIHTGYLFSENMKHWQGPALYAYNDSVFSDSDFHNICELAGAAKKDDPTKIGRFGVGFCATYQLTDVPSFVSRNRIAMFDPHCSYLQGIVSHGEPGVWFDFVQQREDLLRCYADQVQPFEGIFGCSFRQPQATEYRGTLFRFPFRNEYTSRSSEIGPGLHYHRDNIANLVQSLVAAAHMIPLFLQNVLTVELFELHENASPSDMQHILTINKTLTTPRVNILVSHQSGKGQNTSIQECTITVNNCTEKSQDKKTWVVSSALGTGKSKDLAASPQSAKDGLVPFAEVALPVTAEGVPGYCEQGRVFCLLPLSIPVSPLRFHINGCFDISTDRRSLKDLQDENSWNTILIQDAVVRACINLLLHFTHSLSPSGTSLAAYYNIWPLGQTGTTELAGRLISSFQDCLVKEKSKVVRCFKGKGSWESVSDVCVLGEEFKRMHFQNGANGDSFLDQVIQIMLQIGYPMSVLPDELVEAFRQRQDFDGLRWVPFKKYCVHVLLPNLQNLDVHLRNSQMVVILSMFDALCQQHNWLHVQLTDVACVPCKSGKQLKKASEVIDPRNKLFLALFKGNEDKFPLQDLINNEASHSALVKLGMATNYLRHCDIIECAKCVLSQHSVAETVTRSQCLLKYIELHFRHEARRSEQNKTLVRKLSSVPFLPVQGRPEGTTIPWHQAKDPVGAACDLFAADCLGSVFTVACAVDSGTCTPYIQELFSQYFKHSPEVPDVVQHLLSVADWWRQCGEHSSAQFEKEKEFLTDWMPSVYDFLQHALTSGKAVETTLKKLLGKPVIWQDGSFLWPNQLVRYTHVTAPPYIIALSEPNAKHWTLFKKLRVADNLNAEFCAAKLREMKEVFKEGKMEENLMNCVVALATTVAKSSKGGRKPIFLPDNQCVLRPPEVLACAREDVQVPLQVAGRWTFFLHKDVPLATATALGVTDLLDHACSQMVSDEFFSGQDFGQQEDLTDRLNGILDQYEPNISIFREFVQNAEDAGATEIAFVIDHRANYPDTLLFTEQANWRQLQKMPSLLVFNNRSFSEEDLHGITRLGVGGKTGQADKIGRFGIGINVAYHVTDTPTFISCGKGGDPECFCLLDPNRLCVTKDTPGRMWRTTPKMQLKDMNDQMSPFLADVFPEMAASVPGSFEDLSSQWKKGYTIFRLPLTRCNPDLKWQSKLTRGCVMTVQRLQALSKQLMDEAPQMLVFLNNIRRISVYEVSAAGRPISHFASASASVSQTFLSSPELFAQHTMHMNKSKTLSHNSATVYTLGVEIQTAEGGRKVNDWIVSKQFGSKHIPKELLHEGHRQSLLPVAGVAASTSRNLKEGEGQVFVYLPLDDNPSHLPVHVNGHFWVDPSRRHLQHTQEGPLREWNKSLTESILVQCYSTLLHYCAMLVSTRDGLAWFYKLFPKQPPAISHHASSKPVTAFNVVRMTYKYLLDDNAVILSMKPKISEMSLPTKPNWLALRHGSKEPNGYFCFDDNHSQALRELGFRVTDAPSWLYDQLRGASDALGRPTHVSHDLVIAFLKEDIAPRMKEFEKVLKDQIRHIWSFLFSTSLLLTLDGIKGLPIMLTYDGSLSLVDTAKFLPNDKDLSLVPKEKWVDFLSARISIPQSLQTDVGIPVPPQYIAQHIQLPKGGNPVLLDQNHIPTLSHFWSWIISKSTHWHGTSAKVDVDSAVRLLTQHFSNVAVIPAEMSNPRKRILLPVCKANFVLSKSPFIVLDKLGVPLVNFAGVSLTHQELKEVLMVVDKLLENSSTPDNILELLKYCSLFPSEITITAEEAADFIAFISQGQLLRRADTATVQRLKCLPIYSILGCRSDKGRPIDKAKEVFLLPKGVNLEGLEAVQPVLQIIFITAKEYCVNRCRNFFQSLGVQVLSIADFYQTAVIPHLHQMPTNTKVKQVHFICNSCRVTLPPGEHNALMNALREKAFIESGGNLQKVSAFLDPKEPFVSRFLPANRQLPPPWNKHEQLVLLRQLGLQRIPDNSLWLKCAREFCQSHERYSTDAAEVLLESFMTKAVFFQSTSPTSGQLDREMTQFLSEASTLPFVPAEISSQLLQLKLLPTVGVKLMEFPKRITFQGSVSCLNNVQCETSVVAGLQAHVITRKFNAKGLTDSIVSCLGIQPVTIALVCDNLLKLCDLASTASSITSTFNQLSQLFGDIFFKHYKYLCARLSQNEELVKRKLFTTKCVFLECSDSRGFWLVKGSELVEHLPTSQQKCLSPHLQILPASLQQFRPLLAVLGLKQYPDVTHYIHALQVLQDMQTKSVLDPLQRQQSLVAYKALVALAREDEEAAQGSICLPIPLPSETGDIASSDQLVFSDAPWIQRRLPEGLVKFVSLPPSEPQTGLVTLPRCLGVKFLTDEVSLVVDPYIEDDNNQCMYELFGRKQGLGHGCSFIERVRNLVRSSEFASGVCRIIHNKTKRKPIKEEEDAILKVQQLHFMCINDITTTLSYRGQLVEGSTQPSSCLLHESTLFMVSHSRKGQGWQLLNYFAEELSKILPPSVESIHLSAMLSCSHPSQFEQALDDHGLLSYVGSAPFLPGMSTALSSDVDFLFFSEFKVNDIVKYCQPDATFICARVVGVTPGLPPQLQLKVSPQKTIQESSVLVCRQSTESEVGMLLSGSVHMMQEGPKVLCCPISESSFDKDLEHIVHSALTIRSVKQMCFALERILFHLHYLCCVCYQPADRMQMCGDLVRRVGSVLNAAKPTGEGLSFIRNILFKKDKIVHLLKCMDTSHLTGLYLNWSTCAPAMGQEGSESVWSHVMETGRLERASTSRMDAVMWIVQAENDLQLAQHLQAAKREAREGAAFFAEGEAPAVEFKFPSAICFFCHEAVEKSLKAIFFHYCGLRHDLQSSHDVVELYKQLQRHPECPQEVQGLEEYVSLVNEHHSCCRYPEPSEGPPCLTHTNVTVNNTLTATTQFFSRIRRLEVFSGNLELAAIPKSVEEVNKATGFPKNWEMQSMECQVFHVDPVSREFDRRKSQFLRSHPSARVYHIQRIQNKLLWRKYLNKKRQLEHDHTLQSSGEKMLFHGTRNTRPEQIYEGDSGFDMRYSRDGFWGKGNYFAVKSAYSVDYSYQTRDGYQQMLVARVLTGASFRSAPHRFQVPPLREGTGQGEGEVQRRYDSVQGETNGSTVYITYDSDHSYPEYLITFKIEPLDVFSGNLKLAATPKYLQDITKKIPEFLAHWERPREDEDWSTVPKPDVAVTDMELQLKEEQALRHDYEVKLSTMVMEAGPVPLASDVAEGTVDEDLLQQLCYMATGIKQLLISPDGGTFKLGSGDASLVVPPGAVEKETFIRYAIILHGPFVLPAGYKPGSVGVYLNMDGSTLVKPVQLFLCHWCIKQKEDDVTLKFIRAPHTLEVGVNEYTYEELEEEADFTTYTNVGVLTIREPRCLYCVETKVDTIAKYSAITLTRNIPSDETLFFRIQLMCDSLEWSTKLTDLLKQRSWQQDNSDIVPRFSYSLPEMPIKASAASSEGLGWVATIQGQHQVKETDFLMPKGKSKSDMEEEVNSGRFPPCLCYKILFTSPEESRVRPALLKVDLLGADVDLTFSCTFKEELKLSVPSPVSSGPSLSAETPPSSPQTDIHKIADVIKALDGKLDAKWRRFGTFLHVDPAIMDRIKEDKSDVEDCMLQLVEDWVCKKDGTGELPRTWKTVVQVLKEMKVPLPEQLKEQCVQ